MIKRAIYNANKMTIESLLYLCEVYVCVRESEGEIEKQ